MDLLSQSLFVAAIVGLIGVLFASPMVLAKLRAGMRLMARHFPRSGTARSLLETLPEAIIGVDRRGTVRSLNQPAERLFGYREADLLGQPISVVIPGATAFRNGRETGSYASPADSGLNTDAIGQDGQSFPVACFPLRLAARSNQSYVLVRDESHRLRESGLRERCECLTAVLQLFPVPLLIADRNGRVQTFSRACEKVFDGALRTGANLYALFPGVPLGTVLSGEGESGGLARLRHEDSGYLFTPLGAADGPAPDYVALLGHSPDELRRTETQEAAVRLLENLMTEIGGFSELLLTDVRPGAPMHEDLVYVNRASRKAIAVLLALAGGSNGRAAHRSASA